MADVKLDEAWERLERLVTELAGKSPTLVRDGARFMYRFCLDGHDVCTWAIAESPRYCASIDALSVRCSNARALGILLRMAASRQEPWDGSEVWDTAAPSAPVDPAGRVTPRR